MEKEYDQAYQILMQMPWALTQRQIAILESRNGAPPTRMVTYSRSCVLIDDASHQEERIESSLVRKPGIASSALHHRHASGSAGLSIIICVQSLHQGISRSMRQDLLFIAMWSTHGKTCKEELSLTR